MNIDIKATGDLKDDYIEIIFQFEKNININSIFIDSNYEEKLKEKNIQVLGSINGKLYKIIHKTNSIKDLECFANTHYYKFYKIRFYNTTPESFSFDIFNFTAGTTHIILNDFNEERVLENIDNIFISRNLVYLGEIKNKKNNLNELHNELYFEKYIDNNLFITNFEKFQYNFSMINPFKDETVDAGETCVFIFAFQSLT